LDMACDLEKLAEVVGSTPIIRSISSCCTTTVLI
jgi:hypothetical protein